MAEPELMSHTSHTYSDSPFFFCKGLLRWLRFVQLGVYRNETQCLDMAPSMNHNRLSDGQKGHL